jgi:hypothetical protein
VRNVFGVTVQTLGYLTLTLAAVYAVVAYVP